MSDKLGTSNLEAILEELEKRAINHLHEILDEIQESGENENRSPKGEAVIRYLKSNNVINYRYIESQMMTDLTLIELLKFEILDDLTE